MTAGTSDMKQNIFVPATGALTDFQMVSGQYGANGSAIDPSFGMSGLTMAVPGSLTHRKVYLYLSIWPANITVTTDTAFDGEIDFIQAGQVVTSLPVQLDYDGVLMTAGSPATIRNKSRVCIGSPVFGRPPFEIPYPIPATGDDSLGLLYSFPVEAGNFVLTPFYVNVDCDKIVLHPNTITNAYGYVALAVMSSNTRPPFPR
jgi:hypothetical protein